MIITIAGDFKIFPIFRQQHPFILTPVAASVSVPTVNTAFSHSAYFMTLSRFTFFAPKIPIAVSISVFSPFLRKFAPNNAANTLMIKISLQVKSVTAIFNSRNKVATANT